MSNEVILTEDLLMERLREAGLRLTLPRRAVLRALAASDEPFVSARMIMDHVHETAGRMEASTVYRILDDLARIGLVHHISLGNGRSGRWHITLDHDHEHLVCEACGRTIEVSHTEFAPLFELLSRKYGFQTSPHHFAIVGSCEECGPQNDHPHPRGSG
ncbi:MAG: Fur family transcriptional regulator [bacterium]|nr:Fur family transcriptional regulator [bacterium]